MLVKKWADVPGYEGLYRVSNYGELFSVKQNKMLTPPVAQTGYVLTTLKDANGKQKVFGVHRLVAMAFIPNPCGLGIVNHMDRNKSNNRVDNLEWCTQKENVKHFHDTNLGLGKEGDVDQNIMRQLPKKWRVCIRSCYRAADGYWLHLNDGWEASDIAKGCKVIHEKYFTDLWPHIYGIRKTE